jgi:hypothetical protein
MHYAAIHEAYSRWRTNREAIRSIPKSAPSYRLMREALNQTRRDIKVSPCFVSVSFSHLSTV